MKVVLWYLLFYDETIPLTLIYLHPLHKYDEITKFTILANTGYTRLKMSHRFFGHRAFRIDQSLIYMSYIVFFIINYIGKGKGKLKL